MSSRGRHDKPLRRLDSYLRSHLPRQLATDAENAKARRGGKTAQKPRDCRTIGGRSVMALDNVARAVVFGDCIRVQMPASSSFASIRLKTKVEKHSECPTVWFSGLNLSRSSMLRPPLVRRSRGTKASTSAT